jgi:hypothetical protein
MLHLSWFFWALGFEGGRVHSEIDPCGDMGLEIRIAYQFAINDYRIVPGEGRRLYIMGSGWIPGFFPTYPFLHHCTLGQQ